MPSPTIPDRSAVDPPEGLSECDALRVANGQGRSDANYTRTASRSVEAALVARHALPLAHLAVAGPNGVARLVALPSAGPAEGGRRLARPLEIERTCEPDREAMLAAPHGIGPLDRLERALVFAMHEVNGRRRTEEKAGGEHG